MMRRWMLRRSRRVGVGVVVGIVVGRNRWRLLLGIRIECIRV